MSCLSTFLNRGFKDVTYFNPADAAFPIGYNVLGGWKKEERDRAASSVVSVFNAIWNLSLQNPTIHSILGNGIAALMEFPNSTLLWLPRFLTDDDWRKEHTQRLTNPTVRTFWQNDFDQRPKRDRRSASEPVLNRVQELFRDPIMANIFGQDRKAIDIPRHLAERRILIVNLAKAKIGTENASLLGAFIIADIANAAYARIDAVAAEERLAREHQQSPVFPTHDFYLYIDEFQDMANAARFDEMFSQARNGRLSLTCLHQYQGQLSERVRTAVFGNIGTLIAFQVGADDAAHLERAMSGEIKAQRADRPRPLRDRGQGTAGTRPYRPALPCHHPAAHGQACRLSSRHHRARTHPLRPAAREARARHRPLPRVGKREAHRQAHACDEAEAGTARRRLSRTVRTARERATARAGRSSRRHRPTELRTATRA